MYARVVKITKNRKEMTDEMVTEIEEVVMDSAKAQAVIDASKSSMGKLFFQIKGLFFDRLNSYLILFI